MLFPPSETRFPQPFPLHNLQVLVSLGPPCPTSHTRPEHMPLEQSSIYFSRFENNSKELGM